MSWLGAWAWIPCPGCGVEYRRRESERAVRCTPCLRARPGVAFEPWWVGEGPR